MPDANSYRHSNPLNRKPKVTFREKLRLFQIKKGTISLEKRKMKVYLLPHFRSKRLNFLFHPIKIQPDKKSYFPKHDSDPDD
ncbi:hypothetical protein DW778_09735 [Odoribacter splanchnicus]|nr:hypothetical protein DW778_09735 [Odoribacter splanchnicus]